MSHPGQDPNSQVTEDDELGLQPVDPAHVRRRPKDLRKEIKQTIKAMPGKKISNPVMQVTPAARPASNRMTPPMGNVSPAARVGSNRMAPATGSAGRPITGHQLPVIAPINQSRPSETNIPVVSAAPSKAPSQAVIILPAAKPSGRQNKQSGLLAAQPQAGAFTADELAHAAPEQFAEPEVVDVEYVVNTTDETHVRLKPPSKRPGSVRKGASPSRANLHPVGSGRVGSHRGAAAPQVSEQEENTNVIIYAVGGGVLLLGFLFFMFSGKKAAPDVEVAHVKIKDEYSEKNLPPSTSAVTPKEEKVAAATETKAAAPKEEPKSPEAEAAAVLAGKKTETKTDASDPAALEAAKPAAPAAPDAPAAAPDKPAEDVIGAKPAPSKIKSGEDEDVVEVGPKKKAAAGTKVDPLKPGAKPADGDAEGEKKITGVLGGLIEKKEDPAKPAAPVAALPAKRPPFAPAVGKQPSVINDVSRLNGIERDTCNMLQNCAQGWWCRDYSTDASNFNMSFRNKDKAIKLNPINDVISAKMVGTLDIPTGFNTVLRFEVASNDDKSQWNLVVRINGQEILPKQMIRTKNGTDWQEIIVPLGALAGKQFDIQIEGWSAVKDPNKAKQQLVYIRTPHLDWQGKK